MKDNFQIIKGNLLTDFEGDIIAHQVNCQGVMGSGIAYQIKNLYPKLYELYNHYCYNAKAFNKNILGDATFFQAERFEIANLFGQNLYGKGSLFTEYSALTDALIRLVAYMITNNLKKVGFPYMIGCGVGGGDIDTVMDIIVSIFKDTGITVVFYDYN